MATDAAAPASGSTARATGAGFILKKACLSAFVAFGLFALMIGVRTEAGSTSAQLVYWTRFGDLAMVVAAVFGGSILVELLRGRVTRLEAQSLVPQELQRPLALAGRIAGPVLIGLTLIIPVLFYDNR